MLIKLIELSLNLFLDFPILFRLNKYDVNFFICTMKNFILVLFI